MNKKELKELKEKLFYKKENAFDVASAKEAKAVMDYSEGYKAFLDNAKTEREAVASVVKIAEANGYKKYDDKKKYKAGDKFYYVNRNKSIILTVMGKKSLKEGVKISAAHIDSPRLDLKPNPLYEKDEWALFKTHY